MSYSEAFAFGAIVGSLLTGLAIGAVPLICGIIKRKIGLAIGGFFACVVSAFILGALLAIPVAGLFVFLIFKKPKAAQTPVDTNNVQQVAPQQVVPQQDDTQQVDTQQ